MRAHCQEGVLHQTNQIIDQFMAFARLQGVNIDPERLDADGRIHRADVGDLPSGKNDAGYLLRPDGTGWVTNFKADGKPIQFKPELARELTPEEKAQIEVQREAWRRQQAERQAIAVEDAIQRWEESREPKAFPYLQAPKLEPAGLRQGRAQLLVPMLAIDGDGEPGWVGMQRITWAEPGQSADKRFVSGTPTKGAFAIIPIVGADVEAPLRAYEAACKADQVVFCEGIGTALAIHQATGLPVIAAMSAQNLPDVARSLHDKLRGRAVIYADNDGEKAQFKGQSYALRAARILGGARTRIALPEKPGGITPPGYDARDQIRDSGPEAIRNTMASTLDAWQMERRLPPEVSGRNRHGLVRPQTQQQSAERSKTFLTPNQEQPMDEKTLDEIDAQIKDAVRQYNELTKSDGVTPEAKKAARDEIASLKKLRSQVGREPDKATQEQAQTATEPAAAQTQQAMAPNLATDESVQTEENQTVQVETEQGHSDQQGQDQSAPINHFDALNQAAEEVETQPNAPDAQANQVGEQSQPDSDEVQLLREYAELAEPVRAQRAKAQFDLETKHREQREALFGSFDQLRAEKSSELAGMADEHRHAVISMEIAKAVESMRKQQQAERRTLQSTLPEIPSLSNFLEERAKTDPVAARMLEDERERAQSPDAIKGKRIAPVEPAVLKGLTYEVEDGPSGKAVHYARDGERVMSDRGARLDLYKMDDREIEAALLLAEQKYDMDKGLVLTGSRAFQQRAAEIAGKLGLKIQNEDLHKFWEQGRIAALQAEEADIGSDATMMNGSARPAGSIAHSQDLQASQDHGDQGAAVSYPVDQQFLAAESVLAHLPKQGWLALAAVGQGHPLTPEQKAWLVDPDRPVLVDEQDKLTELGQMAYDRMQARFEEEREMLQQQLRTRNIDEELQKHEQEKALKQHAAEHKVEMAAARDAADELQRADDRHAASADPQQDVKEQQIKPPELAFPTRSRPRARDMGLGM